MAKRLPEELKQHLAKLDFRVLKTKAQKSWPEMKGRYVRVCIVRDWEGEPYKLWVLKMQGKYGVDSQALPLDASFEDVDKAINKMRQSNETLGSVMERAFEESRNR